MRKLEDRFREPEDFTPSLIWLNVGETLGSFVRVAFFKVIEPFTNKSLMLSRPGKLLMKCSPPFPPAPTALLFIYNTDSLSLGLKKISCRVVRTALLVNKWMRSVLSSADILQGGTFVARDQMY